MRKTIFLVLLGLICSVGNVWGTETLTLSKSSSDWTSGKSVNVTVGTVSISSGNNATSQTKKWGGGSKTDKTLIKIDSKSLYISSTAVNIKKIEFIGWRGSGSSAGNACDVQSSTSSDGTYSVVSSGFTATKDGNSLASLSNINIAGYDQTGSDIVVTFSDYKQYLMIKKNSSETWIGTIKVWTETAYTIEYDLNSGDGTTPTEAGRVAGATFTLHDGTTGITAPDGKEFAGWNDGTSTYAGGAEYTMGTSNVTLTAQWNDICTATIPGAISKGALSSGTLTLNAAGSPVEGETWYWQTAEDGVLKTNSGTSYDVTAAGTYYVRSYKTASDCWSDAQSCEVLSTDFVEHYTITYDKGTYGTGSIEEGDKVEDEDFTLSSEMFTRAGYAQVGWATSDGGAKVYNLGGSYTDDADITLYPVWLATNTYVATFSEASGVPSGWTFSNAGWGDSKATAAYVGEFVDNSVSTPLQEGKTTRDHIAFAKSTDAIATYDLGYATTISALNVTLIGGSSSAFNETIEYLAANGSTVLKTYTNSLSAGNWAANSISKTDVVPNVRYIRIHGASKWVVMSAFSVTYGKVPSSSVSTLSGRNYASCIPSQKLDFSRVSGITAFIATTVSGGYVHLSSVDVVDQGTPIIVKTDTKGATVEVPYSEADEDDVTGNLLVEGDGSTEANSDYYYLAQDEFHLATSGTLQVGKAYLDASGLSAPSVIRFVEDTGNATNISNIESADEAVKFIQNGQLYIKRNGVVYDALGRVIR